MPHTFDWEYGIWSIHRHAGTLSIGDPVVLQVLKDKTRSFRRAKVGEIPDGFVMGTRIDPDAPGTHIIRAIEQGQAYGIKVRNITGLSVLPHESQAVFYRPSIADWDGEKGIDGIVGGVIQSPRYDYLLASGNSLEINKLLVVTHETPTLGVLQMPRENVHAGDHVYLANEYESGQTVKVTDLYPPKAGVREISVAPGKTLLLRRNDTDTGWESDTSIESIVTVNIHFDAEWIRQGWPETVKKVKFQGGQLLCKGFGNLRSNRATSVRWHIPPSGSPASVDSNDRTKLRLPDPNGDRIGLLVEINGKADGTGTVLYRQQVFAGTTVDVPVTSSKAISVSFKRDGGKATVQLSHLSSDTSNWGTDAYLLAYELIASI